MKKTLIGVASIVLFIELMDTTILYACAIPVAKDFGVDSSNISSAILSYLIGTCIFIPLVSFLAKKFNRIKVIILCLLMFSLLSLFCGISSNLYMFSILRFFQGIAISIGSAMTILTLLANCKSDEIVQAMASINIPALVGTAIGPFVGAIFSYYISWRVAFIINVPICMGLIMIIFPLKREFENIKNSYSFDLDIMGLFLLSTFLIFTAIGIEKLSFSLNVVNLSIFTIGITLGIIYALIWRFRQSGKEKKSSLLELNVFKNQNFLAGAIINFISRSAMCGIPLLLSNVLQQCYGYSVFKAGTYLAIIAIASISAKFLSSFIIKLGIYNSIIVYATCTSISILLLSHLDLWTVSGYLWLICFMFGFVTSFLYTSMNSLLYVSLHKDDIPNASNIGTIIQQFSIGLGIVLAVGSFNLLLSTKNIVILSNNYFQIADVFKKICTFLAVIMIFNLIVLAFFHLHKERFFITYKKGIYDTNFS